MIELLTFALEAHSAERNHHRRYEIEVGRDLLGDWTVTVRFGRVGQVLRTLHLGGHDLDGAQRVVRGRLRRRMSAPRRIGCRYVLQEVGNCGETQVVDWVPSMLLDAARPLTSTVVVK